MLFKSTDGQKNEETGPRLPSSLKSPLMPPFHSTRSSPLVHDIRTEKGPQLELLKAAALKKQKRHPARIPPLPDRPSNNNNNQQSASELPGVALTPLEDTSGINLTLDEMDQVLGDLKSWREEHAKKMAEQWQNTTTEAPRVNNENYDSGDDELQALYAKAKERWSTISTWKPPIAAKSHTLKEEDEAKVQSFLQPEASNVSKLQQLREEVFQLHVRDLSRQWQETLNNDPEEAEFEASLLELESGVQSYAKDLDALLQRLDTFKTSFESHHNEASD
ncbi:hypothetical protein THRCLA_01878 [Thraustotheca clavata]|uniref:Uncharacterized protein n=1 Tax=Thraustotheca clavata TaxID=74557 RepID=A0A1W0A704_9STRA|nr:hypothetical protein THRCLA_01878 [Thraustotheca clavata]